MTSYFLFNNLHFFIKNFISFIPKVRWGCRYHHQQSVRSLSASLTVASTDYLGQHTTLVSCVLFVSKSRRMLFMIWSCKCHVVSRSFRVKTILVMLLPNLSAECGRCLPPVLQFHGVACEHLPRKTWKKEVYCKAMKISLKQNKRGCSPEKWK